MRKLITIVVCILPSVTCLGQSLQGKIIGRQNQVIEGAHIQIMQSREHTHTNHLGQFIIHDIEIGDSLLVSHISFESDIIIVRDLRSELVIKLADKIISIDEIVVSPKIDAVNLFADVNLHANPVNSSQEILQKVPGLIIGQHAGGGKAEQLFLRGFDIDHGTDINITVDGMPVNMVSHAHGQGYADLHFLIPETVENLNFGKGPYYADQGNFTTAGYVDFRTKDRLDHSGVKLEIGRFNTQRLLGMFNLINNDDKHSAYIASEHHQTDGPFESPQNFNRTNLMGKYTGYLSNHDRVSVSASYFTSKWDASGQIPQRAVDDGSISRFGAIDDSEGGNTSRTNLLFDYSRNISNKAFFRNTAYYTYYDFELYSNFTFFLNDPVNGDQIRQKESRQLFGLKSVYNHHIHIGGADGLLQAGLGLRNDQSNNNELSHTVNRTKDLDSIQMGDINETNIFGFISMEFEIGKWFFNPSIRVDQFKFIYRNQLLGFYKTQAESQAIVNPKFNILYNYSKDLQMYLKTGKGFHSNDARVVVAQNGREILPDAYGADIGFIWKPIPNILMNTAFWYLFLEQEFVYVGDEGIVEPSGKTRRAGIDFSVRYQPFQWLFLDSDINYTRARSVDDPEGINFIPLVPDLTVTGGLGFAHGSGAYGGARIRSIKDRPANEDNSIVAKGYTVVDINGGYQWRNLDFGISIQNLFNTDWNETQFATESRLHNEAQSVEEIHFTPGTPFNLKAILSYKF